MEEVMGDFIVMILRPSVRDSLKDDSKASRMTTERRFWRHLRNVLAVVFLMSCLGVALEAQDVASITGTVVDKTGSAITDADVKLTDTRTGATFTTKTGTFG